MLLSNEFENRYIGNQNSNQVYSNPTYPLFLLFSQTCLHALCNIRTALCSFRARLAITQRCLTFVKIPLSSAAIIIASGPSLSQSVDATCSLQTETMLNSLQGHFFFQALVDLLPLQLLLLLPDLDEPLVLAPDPGVGLPLGQSLKSSEKRTSYSTGCVPSNFTVIFGIRLIVP